MARVSSDDPLRGFKFRVTWDDLPQQIGFKMVDGLKEETAVVEYREGTDPATQRKLPGLTSFDNLKLERGLDRTNALREWRLKVFSRALSGQGAPVGSDPDFRKDVQIILFDYNDPGESKVWEVRQAWPSKLEISALDAQASEVVVESMELAHEGWTLT